LVWGPLVCGPWKAAMPDCHAGSVVASAGKRPLSSRMTMPWMNAQAALARSGVPAACSRGAAARCSRPAGSAPRGKGLSVMSR
jgi:hypothetical protein